MAYDKSEIYPVFEIAANLGPHRNKAFITWKAKIISANKYKTAGVPLILYNFVPAGILPVSNSDEN